MVFGIPSAEAEGRYLEVENVKALGVKIEANVVIGKSVVDELMENKGFEAVFIGSARVFRVLWAFRASRQWAYFRQMNF